MLLTAEQVRDYEIELIEAEIQLAIVEYENAKWLRADDATKP